MTPESLAVCNDPTMMDSLRILLLSGICLALGGIIADQAQANYARLRKPRTAPSEECKLHSRKLADCPPGSHNNSDDSSSQEPPTDDDSGATDGRGESALPNEVSDGE